MKMDLLKTTVLMIFSAAYTSAWWCVGTNCWDTKMGEPGSGLIILAALGIIFGSFVLLAGAVFVLTGTLSDNKKET